MKVRSVILFLTAVFVFSFLSQITARALWIQKEGHLMWIDGEVLGKGDSKDYTTYYIHTPTSTPTPTPTATETPTPTPNTSTSSASLSSSLPSGGIGIQSVGSSSSSQGTLFDAAAAALANILDLGNGGNSENAPGQQTPSNTPTPTPTNTPTPTPTPTIAWCGSPGYYCNNNTQKCYNGACWLKCDYNNPCSGAYSCQSGICLPTGGNTRTGGLAPQRTANPEPDTSASSSVSSQTSGTNDYSGYVPPTPVNQVVRPTNKPYPTRTPQNSTYFNSSGGSSPNLAVPTPTPIPDFLRGQSSTIVIEEGSSTTIIKGEDVKAITINVPVANAAEHQTSSAARTQQTDQGGAAQAPAPLDVSLQQKTGTKYAVRQEELVVQKGKQKVTITVGDNNKGTLVLTQNDIKATVAMTLSINPNTNILTVDTPSGPMRVSIMPDDAVAIAKQLKIADPNKVPDNVTLLSRNSQLEYKISATKLQKLLWLIPVVIPQDVYLSADTGGLIEIKRSQLYSILTLFTF